MSEGDASSIRVRIAGQEIQVADLETLLNLADNGQIGGAAEVRLHGSAGWLPLAKILAERRPRARPDPWKAWEAAEHVDADSIWAEFAPESPAPAAASEPLAPSLDDEEEVTDPAPPPSEPEELPLSAMRPVEDEAIRRPAVDPGRRPAGKVIAFPSRGPVRPRVEGATALAPAEPVLLRPSPPRVPVEPLPPPPPPPVAGGLTEGVRWWRLGLITLAGLAALALVRWFVVGQATEGQPDWTPVAAGPVPVSPPPAPAPPAEEPSSAIDALFAAMEVELREQMSSEAFDIQAAGDLEDALVVELRRVRLDVAKVEAVVTTWGGRKGDIPETAVVRITLRSRATEFDREVAAVGLVLGKYIQRYNLKLSTFEVIFEGLGAAPLRRTMSPDAARLFYMQRLSMIQFLTGSGSQPEAADGPG